MQRRDPREPIRLVVEYDGVDDLVGDFTENLSKGGTFVATARALDVGARVRLALACPGLLERVVISGVVRWTRADDAQQPGAGIEFESGPERDLLAAAIDRIRARHPDTVTRSLEVLVVDDNQFVAEFLRDGLLGSVRRDGAATPSFAVRTAADGRSALESLRRTPCDVLLVDIYLPILDGSRVIALARGELGLADMQIIAFSAGGDAARDAALAAGANEFLDKPVRLRQILDAIQRLRGAAFCGTSAVRPVC